MQKQNPNKIKLLKIWEILVSDSDEDNPLSTTTLQSRLSEQGIECDRRTLYSDIKALNDFGYEVMSELRNHSNHYYVIERGFDKPELKILMDAVTAANFISTKKTKELHNKIAGLAGNNRAELLKKSQNAVNLTKIQNESIYYAINELDEAILAKKKVSFQYFDFNLSGERIPRHEGERYLVSPIATVCSDDRYYLVAIADNRDSLVHYRIDKMQSVQIEQQQIDNPPWFKQVNLAQHKKQLFSMFGGKTVRATFEASNSLVDVVFDKFGTKTFLKDIGNNRFTFSVEVQTSPIFFGWCLSFGDKLKVTAPNDLIQNLKEYLKKISTQY